jgi:maltose alpha-D-glucosyltransferase/alpha-amylase
MTEKIGYKDSRFFNRGPFDEEKRKEALSNANSDSYKIFHGIKKMLDLKKENEDLFSEKPNYENIDDVFKVTRKKGNKSIVIYNNLTAETKSVENINLQPHEYFWKIS